MNASLPWEDDGTTTVASGSNGHARATQLAHAAMAAAAAQPADPNGSDYAREQVRFQQALTAMRADSARRHVENNNRLAAEASARKAERQAAHQARQQATAEAARQRKLAKAA